MGVMLGSHLQDLLLQQVAPAAGVVVAICLFCSPVPGALQARKDNNIGSLNPIPFPLIAANCAAWVAYAYVKGDIFVFLANDPGLISGLFLTITAYGLAAPKTKNFLLYSTLFFAVVLTFAGAATVFVKQLSSDDHLLLWGLLANAILLAFYASPLSTVAEVVSTKSSASLYAPLCVMNVTNSLLWLVYGYATGDPFIWTPNAAGLLLGLLQLALCAIYPRDARYIKGQARRRSRGVSDQRSVSSADLDRARIE